MWLEADEVPAGSLTAWLRNRYIQYRAGHRYRVATYKAQDGKRYVDYVLFETLTDNDLVEMRLRGWNWSKSKVRRGKRLARRKLTKEQRARLKSLMARTEMEFYAALDREAREKSS